jgi:hypothetical protein
MDNPLLACVGSRRNVFTESLPSNGYRYYSIIKIRVPTTHVPWRAVSNFLQLPFLLPEDGAICSAPQVTPKQHMGALTTRRLTIKICSPKAISAHVKTIRSLTRSYPGNCDYETRLSYLIRTFKIFWLRSFRLWLHF